MVSMAQLHRKPLSVHNGKVLTAKYASVVLVYWDKDTKLKEKQRVA